MSEKKKTLYEALPELYEEIKEQKPDVFEIREMIEDQTNLEFQLAFDNPYQYVQKDRETQEAEVNDPNDPIDEYLEGKPAKVRKRSLDGFMKYMKEFGKEYMNWIYVGVDFRDCGDRRIMDVIAKKGRRN